jgi:hypothetical protein
MLLQWPDLYYHTSMDTIDKVSEDMLKRVGWITTVVALTLANADAGTAFRLATQTVTRGIARIEETFREAVEELSKKKEDSKLKDKPDELAKTLAKTADYYKGKLEHTVWREQKAVKSVEKLVENSQLNTFVGKYCADIANLGRRETAKLEEALGFIAKTSNLTLPTQLEEPQTNAELKKLVPKRLFKGSLDSGLFKKELGEKEYEWYEEIGDKDPDFEKKSAEILNFMDGKRNAYEILKAVSAEYTETDPERVVKFLRDLEKTKLITLS